MSDVARPDFPEGLDATSFASMIDSLRTFQDRISGAAPPAEAIDEIKATLDRLSRELERFLVPESRGVAGQLLAVPGRAQALVPPVFYDAIDAQSVRARVMFGRFHRGRGPAVHGGSIPLVFDELLAIFVNAADRPLARTASLAVDYRNVTPLDVELRLEARMERIEGRKRFAVATMHAGDTLCAEATALFVELRPGRP